MKSSLATAGMVLSIIGLCISFIPLVNFLSFILGVLAIIFGTIALIKKCLNKGFAITAIILGVLSVLIPLLMITFFFKALANGTGTTTFSDGNMTKTIYKKEDGDKKTVIEYKDGRKTETTFTDKDGNKITESEYEQ